MKGLCIIIKVVNQLILKWGGYPVLPDRANVISEPLKAEE